MALCEVLGQVPPREANLLPPAANSSSQNRPLIVLVEGDNDVKFLRQIGKFLHDNGVVAADLNAIVSSGQALIVTAGGGISQSWASCLAPLRCPEFHLYDRENEPEFSRRRRLVDQANARPNCVAVLTAKRALENYLHSDAIVAAGGPELQIRDDGDVAELLALHRLKSMPSPVKWTGLSSRTKRRLRYQAKRWLNSQALCRMTVEMLAQRDPQGEVIGWLTTILKLSCNGG